MDIKIPICLLLTISLASAFPADANSLVVSSTEPSKENSSEKQTAKEDTVPSVPKIFDMKVTSNVTNRFANTSVVSKVKNVATTPQEATFSVVLPETAYITGFVMEIDGKSYKAYVKEKEEAKQIYDQAIQRGQAAAHVEANARDSNRFTVSVNVEPQKKAIFTLTYEELLQRQNEQYEIVINIHPGQPVKDLNVEVNIDESRPLKFVKSPPLRSGNEISKNDNEDVASLADIVKHNSTSTTVKFNPNVERQKQLAAGLRTKEENGLAGQFVVQYDVERDPHGGEVLLKDGYFVHFFAPSDLKPLPKQVIFVLDTSGSMDGIRIKQLKEAMNSILEELKKEDLFSIVEFSSIVKVWNVDKVQVDYEIGENPYSYFSDPKPNKTNEVIPPPYAASEDNIKKAKEVVGKLNAFGGTDIKAALEVGLKIVKNNKQVNDSHQPIIVFLTDGEPTVGTTNTEQIISTVSELNSGAAPIFSLSFGDGADKHFLQKISLKNLGFARHIYEAADASLQLQDFYKKISSPLLNNVKFNYLTNATKLTKTHFPIFFHGSELVVAGVAEPGFMPPSITGRGVDGPIHWEPKVENPIGDLERLWAYLTIKQILEARDAAENKTQYTKKALDIALKYSFVTPVSSLVVVKPNDTSAINTEDASKSPGQGHPHFIQRNFAKAGAPTLALSGAPAYFGGRMAFGRIPAQTLQYGIRYSRPRTTYLNAFSASGFAAPASAPRYPAPQPLNTRADSYSGGAPIFDMEESAIDSAAAPSIAPSYPSTTFATTTVSVDPYSPIKAQLPWISNILSENGTLTTPTGNYEVSVDNANVTQTECPQTVNTTAGLCTHLMECPQIFSNLTDSTVFNKYFCVLDNKYAGICCPKKVESP